MACATLLGAYIAAARQLLQHLRQCHRTLPLQARLFLRPMLRWVFLFLLVLLFLLLDRRWGKPLAHFDCGRVTRNMADQATMLGVADERLMHELRQFHAGEFGERAGEGGFMRQDFLTFPAAQSAQLWIVLQALGHFFIAHDVGDNGAATYLKDAEDFVEELPLGICLDQIKDAVGNDDIH